jgi:hypothetical protein
VASVWQVFDSYGYEQSPMFSTYEKCVAWVQSDERESWRVFQTEQNHISELEVL